MKASEIRTKKPEEIDSLEESLSRDLAMLELQVRMGDLREMARCGLLRREIARIQTIRNEMRRKG